MKHYKITISAILAGMLFAAPGMADVTTTKDAKPDDWNRSIKLQPLNAKQSQNVSAFDKTNQLRCWQHGDLIVLENDWKPVDSGKGSLMSKGSKRLHAYDYGDTFCIYLGG